MRAGGLRYIPLIRSGRLFIDRVVRRTQKASKEGLCKSLHSSSSKASSSSLDTSRRLLPQLFSDFANSIQRPFKTAAAEACCQKRTKEGPS